MLALSYGALCGSKTGERKQAVLPRKQALLSQQQKDDGLSGFLFLYNAPPFAPSGSLSHPPRHRCALPPRTRGPAVSAHPAHASTIATGAPPYCRHVHTGNTTMTSPSVTNTPTLYQHAAAHALCLATLTATASATQCSHTRLKQASLQLWRAMPSPNALPAVTMPWCPCTTIYATFVGFVLAAWTVATYSISSSKNFSPAASRISSPASRPSFM